ncbi:hypothetical protein DVH24_010939 [Malus domestica]|uniref:S-adenosylmethionine-dependent methyltransferase domain-containing protein n=1 Tax=Malus domestica TaxID=3750 RepID=A0A498JXV9_MALDO|nr:hypothetical protein DVH24_010939 [Malus domestica]
MVDRAGLGNPSLPRAKWSTAKVAIVGVKGWPNTSQDGCEENPTSEKYNNNLRKKKSIKQLINPLNGCHIDASRVAGRINEAVELRKSLGLPSASTNVWRLEIPSCQRSPIFLLISIFHHRFSGLEVVALSAAWVVALSAAWTVFGSLKEEGLDVSKSKERDPYICPQRTMVGYPTKCNILQAAQFILFVMENGIFYSISLEGQKTGFNADQRGNRQFISTISDGQKVLDMFCYSGSFALNAAQGGAANVIGIDSSLPAIELAKENVLNNMDPGRITFLKEDASEFMKGALSRNESWDIVILDPPKLAPRKKKFEFIGNATDKERWSSRDLFMFGSYDAKWDGAASAARRKLTVLRDAVAARNHPIDPSYPEGKYLSNVLPRVL